MSNPVVSAKRVLEVNEAVLYGVFGMIRGSGYFPPRMFLNEFLMSGNDPCDQDQRMGTWMPIELSADDYREVLSWWVGRHPDAVEDRLGAECWNDWVHEILNR
jgi:hypothetical protein